MHKQIHDFYSIEGIPPEMVQGITFMRQWLNEDRKCDPLVTARDIWHWLEPGYKEAIQQASEKQLNQNNKCNCGKTNAMCPVHNQVIS